MCGIAGIVDPTLRGKGRALRQTASEMAATLIHRGPDAQASWADENSGIAFGHARLSIIDLSEAGAQPMTSRCGRCTITYNGEVYNAPELRQELTSLGREFRGHSDTEVIVEACAQWGVEATLKRLIGMFAFGLWDRKTATLTIARDRVGIKPLYWGTTGQAFFFTSELKALRHVPGWKGRLDPQALAAFLTYSYVPAPFCIFEGVHKLEPGTLLEFSPGRKPDIRVYWSLDDVVGSAAPVPPDADDDAMRDSLEELLLDAVERRMVSDVPLGAFLSGGIDSSTVTALMQKVSARPVRTFSIGFHEQGYNEAQHAKAVAEHLGTNHTEQYVTAGQTRDVIPQLPGIFDEPFADSSQIPTYLVSRLTRQHVTVALSGDGGDEVFAGYNRYGHGQAMASAARFLPAPVRAALSKGMLAVPPSAWDGMSRAIPSGMRPRLMGDKVHKLAKVVAEDEIGAYRKLISQCDEAWTLVPGAYEPQGHLFDPALRTRFADGISWMQYLDTLTYLPDDILTKVDRASMAVSLEARVPILDHRVIEFAWSLPQHFKIRNGTTKWILREVLYKHVPRKLVERPKMGFGVPIESWLRGPLREWAEELLAQDALGSSGLLTPAPIREKWQEHLSGRRNWQHFLWNVLMFQAWFAENSHAMTAKRKPASAHSATPNLSVSR